MPPFVNTNDNHVHPHSDPAAATVDQTNPIRDFLGLLYAENFQGSPSAAATASTDQAMPTPIEDVLLTADFGIVDSLTLSDCKHLISDIFDDDSSQEEDDSESEVQCTTTVERGASKHQQRGHRRSGRHKVDITFDVKTKTG